MTIFAIIAPAPSLALEEAMKKVFPEAFLEFAPGQFVASAPNLTSQQVGEKLGPNGQVGQFVIFAVAGHWGFHRKDLWEWLAVRA